MAEPGQEPGHSRGFVLPGMFHHLLVAVRDGKRQWVATLGSKGAIVPPHLSFSLSSVYLY